MPVARINGIKLNYKVEGRGEPFVMIAGIGVALGSLDAQAAIFKKHFTVIRTDNRGAGKTDKPVGPYSTRMMAEDVAGLMDHLHIQRANLLGYSMGGMIAQEVAINHPDRIEKLVLCATYPCVDQEIGPSREARSLVGLPKLSYLRGFLKLTSNNAIRPYLLFLRMVLTSGRASAAAFQAQSVACQNHNALDRLRSIQVPTLVVVGTKDRLIQPRSSEVLAREIPRSRLLRIPDGSHLIPVERAKDLNREVLQFLVA